MTTRQLLATALFLALFFGNAHADSEIKIQGRNVTTTVWNQIDDDNGVDENDSPRGANGTEFGNVKLGEDKTRDFRIQNTGNQTLNITSASADSSQYAFIGLNLPIAIPANDDHEFKIRYTPAVFATRTLRIVINNDEGGNNSSERRYTFRVDGTGVGPDLTIFGGNNQDDPITDGAGTPSPNDSERRHFGTFQSGPGFATTRTFTLSNDGNRALNLSNPRFTGPGAAFFEYSGVNAGVNLGEGNARDFEITFDRRRAGTFDATFLVDTNDERGGRGTYSFAVRGNATGIPIIEVKGQDRNVGVFNLIDNDEENPRAGNGTGWGNRGLGDMVPIEDHEFRITNDGTDDLTITSITTSNSVVFPVNDIALPITLAPGLRTNFFVSFFPRSARDYTATITIGSDDFLDETFKFQVGGTGTGLSGPPAMMIVEGLGGSPPTYSEVGHRTTFPRDPSLENGTEFEPTILGQTRIHQFRIKNDGVQLLQIYAAGSGSPEPEYTIVGLDDSSLSNANTGDLEEFEIHYTPTSTGYQSAIIEVRNNDPDIGGTFRIQVGGFGIEEPAGEGPVVLIVGGEGLRGKVLPGSDRPSAENGTVIGYNGTHLSVFRIISDGDEDLKISEAQIDGDGFELLSLGEEAFNIGPGRTHTFGVEYTGPPDDEREAQVIIATSDPEAEEFTFVIRSIPLPEIYPPKITAVRTDGPDVLLTVDAPPGRTFQIFVSLDLQGWIPILGQSNRPAGLHRLPSEISNSPRRFYKVEED